jgi:hypothetical protein
MVAIRCVPGIPVKKTSACISPLQEPISHIVPVMVLSGDGSKVIEERWEPNDEDYPEYAWLIQNYIDHHREEIR